MIDIASNFVFNDSGFSIFCGGKMERERTAVPHWTAALEHLQFAIRLLDESSAPAQIAAHVDLAVHQLQEAINARPPNYLSGHMDTNAEPH